MSVIVQGIFAKIGPDLELRWGDLISSPVDSIVSLVSPKKSYGPNSVGKNYFSATPFSLLAKNATGGHNAEHGFVRYQKKHIEPLITEKKV